MNSQQVATSAAASCRAVRRHIGSRAAAAAVSTNRSAISSLPKCQQYSSTPQQSWSKTLTYASPESDFSSETLKEHANRIWDESHPSWSDTLSFSAPESDFASSTSESLEDAADRLWHQNEETVTNMAYSLSYASPESDFTSPQIYAMLTDLQKRQLDHCDEASSPEYFFPLWPMMRPLALPPLPQQRPARPGRRWQQRQRHYDHSWALC